MKALIYIKEYEGHSKGSLLMRLDDNDANGWTHHLLSSKIVLFVDIPEELMELPNNVITGKEKDAVPEHWINGESKVFNYADIPDGEEANYTHIAKVDSYWILEKNNEFPLHDKTERINQKFDKLNSDVAIEMTSTYDTKNPDSAVANYLTWIAYKNNPAYFATKGLKARHAIASFEIHNALDTDAKILEYATALLLRADEYTVSREQKINQFILERETILAE